jgi:hypothetical protein
MKRAALTFGILAGALIFAYMFVLFLIFGDFGNVKPEDMVVTSVLGYLRYLILLLGITMAILTFRKETPGPIGYKRVFLTGLYATLIVALFVGAMEFVYMAFLDPHFVEHYTTVMMEGMKKSGASAAEMAARRRELDNFAWMSNPWATGVFYFSETTVIGTIFTLVAAIFGRRKEGAAPQDVEAPLLDRTA